MIERISNPQRFRLLLERAVASFDLDLTGMTVLTEAASGAFVSTPLLAALGRADRVIAVTRDSTYGTALEVSSYVDELADGMGLSSAIEVSTRPAREWAASANVVTNLGFVRPIDRDFLDRLPPDAAVAFMFEPWEYREGDVDLDACRALDVPILGTCETDSRLMTFRYVGLLAIKLLLEAQIGIVHSRIVVVGDGPFGHEIASAVKSLGGTVDELDARTAILCSDDTRRVLEDADAVVIAVYETADVIVGGASGIPITWLAEADPALIHISGLLDHEAMAQHGLMKHPDRQVGAGVMTVTTAYVGPRPVVDLHAAGLSVGAALVRGRRRFSSTPDAIEHAMRESPAMNWS